MKAKKFKEFFATSWAIDNKTSIYVLVVFISILGIFNYLTIPKEQFPELVIPTIMVSTPYPGASPADIENLVTRPIEKQIKGLAGVKKVTSTSMQDFSSIVVEFNTDVIVSDAKQRVKDAIDKSRTDLPNDLPNDPTAMEIDFSEIPIMYINISGNYDLAKLKKFADKAQDRLEELKEITRVDIVGALEREILIDVDMNKMQAATVTFSDIERAVAAENINVSAGTISSFGMKRALRVVGEFKDVETLQNIVIQSSSGAQVFLKDIADVKDSFKEQESFSRLNGENVITLSVIKKSGQNLIEASDKIKTILDNEFKGKIFPKDVKMIITNDTSRFTRNSLEELNNTIIIGFILVTIVLMFFMGFKNAFFVGLSVPLSMAVALIVLPGFGFTMNMMVMFAFIFALGIVVDDAIVVIENTHRIHRNQPNIVLAAKMAAGEVFLPILSGTLTTLAPFFPLAFWPGIVGKFMYFMPVTLIITLFASLFVAYIINPVFAVSFMKHEYEKVETEKVSRLQRRWFIALVSFAIVAYIVRVFWLGNLVTITLLLIAFHQFLLRKWIHVWQDRTWPSLMKFYEKNLRYFLLGRRPLYIFVGVVSLFIITMILTKIVSPPVVFFPDNQPNNIYVYIKTPEGTDQKITDSITTVVENKVNSFLGKNNPAVESVISNVALGAGDDNSFERSVAPNKGKVSINFVEHKFRQDISTTAYLNSISKAVKGVAGAEITVEKNRMGPPTGSPINIEVSGDNLNDLVSDANKFKRYIDSLQIPGMEVLKNNFADKTPELLIDIDRERANRAGISTGQIGLEVRTAVFGKEVSKYKEDEDEYSIQLRYGDEQRKNINSLMDLRITYRDMNSGKLRSIPLSTVAKVQYADTYGGITRENMKRVITLSSSVVPGYNANEIVAKINTLAASFQKHDGVDIKLTGEQEDQAETMAFLAKAMLIAIGLIFFILISQFNSMSKSMIILSEVIFSIIGVLLGIMIFGMSISIIMTGMGIVALGGIVVRNGILIVEFTDVLRSRGVHTREAIVRAGLTRVTPVVLTATATMLGLVPLAVGMNINFTTIFTELNPHIYFGGDNVMFWGPLSWTIIFGLSFATILTLIFVPAMYLMTHELKIKSSRRKSNRKYRKALAKASQDN
jgi:multidrug efflux pump